MTNYSSHIDCAWTRDKIDLYLDGDVTGDDTVRLQSHLERCVRCSGEMALARRVLGELRNLPAERCPDGIADDMIEAARGAGEEGWRLVGRRSGGWRTIFMRPAMVMGLVIAVVVGGVAFERWHRSRNQVTPEEVARAEAALKWTFAYVNDVSRRATFAVADEVIGTHVVGPVRSGVRHMMSEDQPQTDETNGGSQ